MKLAMLERYQFSSFHKSHIGAIKSCLDYYGIDCSSAWVHGMTGNAFIMTVDDKLCAPNIGEPEEEMFALARHLGVDIQGYHSFGDAQTFKKLQSEAWDAARSALDRGWPVFAKELDLGNETSVIYAYDEEGYYTHSWHGGDGHEGFDNVIPWTKLGHNYCPCISCKSRSESVEWANEGVYIGDRQEGGFISLHYATKVDPSDIQTAFQSAIGFVLTFSGKSSYQWGGRTFYTGSAAYDKWIGAVKNNTIQGFYMGYFADLGQESRHNAYHFLKEASERFTGIWAEHLMSTANHYKKVKDAFGKLCELFPWSQPHAPIDDPDRRQQAMELLQRIKMLDMDGMKLLEGLLKLRA